MTICCKKETTLRKSWMLNSLKSYWNVNLIFFLNSVEQRQTFFLLKLVWISILYKVLWYYYFEKIDSYLRFRYNLHQQFLLQFLKADIIVDIRDIFTSFYKRSLMHKTTRYGTHTICWVGSTLHYGITCRFILEPINGIFWWGGSELRTTLRGVFRLL